MGTSVVLQNSISGDFISKYTRTTIFLNYFSALRNPVPPSYCGCDQAFLICQFGDEENIFVYGRCWLRLEKLSEAFRTSLLNTFLLYYTYGY